MYSCGSFNRAESIGVVCRGLSANYLEKIEHNFDHCYLVGQFDKSLLKLGRFVRNKKTVQIINKCAIALNEKVYRKHNILDIQCNFDGWSDRPLSPNKMKLYRKIQRNNPWASVYLAPPGIREKRASGWWWATTGLYAIDLASFWHPKNIWICGLDFYQSKYFAKEKLHVGMQQNAKREKKMMKNLYEITKRDSDIKFHLFTGSKNVKSTSNLRVTHV
jgi:hypothetical protein